MDSMPNFPVIIDLNWIETYCEATKSPHHWAARYGAYSVHVCRYVDRMDYYEVSILDPAAFVVGYRLWDDGRMQVME